jgi:Putative polyhydroxyalkanoic acid system protein (PHA_gran_rgn)
MSSSVSASIPHRLGKEEAIRRIKDGFGTLRGHLATLISIDREEWTENVVQFQMRGFGQSAAGTITVVDHSVHIEVTLPWVLAKIAERLLPAMRRETTLLLERK